MQMARDFTRCFCITEHMPTLLLLEFIQHKFRRGSGTIEFALSPAASTEKLTKEKRVSIDSGQRLGTGDHACPCFPKAPWDCRCFIMGCYCHYLDLRWPLRLGAARGCYGPTSRGEESK